MKFEAQKKWGKSIRIFKWHAAWNWHGSQDLDLLLAWNFTLYTVWIVQVDSGKNQPQNQPLIEQTECSSSELHLWHREDEHSIDEIHSFQMSHCGITSPTDSKLKEIAAAVWGPNRIH